MRKDDILQLLIVYIYSRDGSNEFERNHVGSRSLDNDTVCSIIFQIIVHAVGRIIINNRQSFINFKGEKYIVINLGTVSVAQSYGIFLILDFDSTLLHIHLQLVRNNLKEIANVSYLLSLCTSHHTIRIVGSFSLIVINCGMLFLLYGHLRKGGQLGKSISTCFFSQEIRTEVYTNRNIGEIGIKLNGRIVSLDTHLFIFQKIGK
ncbi:membrane protein [gut metagenome]|uniref:Membrane protein n=1 Tax=gut metagenome TaxID=749906 RepID=J9GU59_9ZZZZ